MTDEIEPAARADNSGNLFVKNAEDEYDWKRVAPASEEEVPDFSVPLVRADNLQRLLDERIGELEEMYEENEVSHQAPSPPPAHRVDELERLRNQLDEVEQ